MPEYEIKVDHPDVPKGEQFQVAQLYVDLKNGSTAHVDADAAQAFKDFHGRTVLEAFKNNPHFEVSSVSSKKDGD